MTCRLKLGVCQQEVECENKSVNLNRGDLLDVVETAALMISEKINDPINTLILTPETGTLAIAYLLRRVYRYEVQIIAKKARRYFSNVLSEEYYAFTSDETSILYLESSFTTQKQVVYVDVVFDPESRNAISRLLSRLDKPLTIASTLVIFDISPLTEYDVTKKTMEDGVTALGDLQFPYTEPAAEYRFRSSAEIPTGFGTIWCDVFTTCRGKEAVALRVPFTDLENVNLRVHDACFTSEVFRSLKCDCREQLETALRYIIENSGMVIYLFQEGRGIGLANKIAAYNLQITLQYDTVQANRALGLPDDLRTYVAVKDILDYHKVKSVRLMSNNTRKFDELLKLGINVTERIPIIISNCSKDCQKYLRTKAQKMNHLLSGYITEIRFYEPSEEYGFLSNFYPCSIVYRGEMYPSTEHAYQSQKFDKDIREIIKSASTPAEAFALSRKYQDHVRSDWKDCKDQVMEEVITLKFSNEPFKSQLLNTGNSQLIEASPSDTYWGPPHNKLGRILAKVRSSFLS